MQILIDIPESFRPGIAAARAARNASMPAEVQTGTNEDGTPIMAPNPDIIASDENYMQWVIEQAVKSYNVNLAAPAPAPAPPAGEVGGVPQEVTRRQAIQALINRNLYQLVQPAIDAIADPTERATMQNEWDNSLSFQRQRPSLIALATAIGITDLDEMFVYAATL